MYIAISVWSCAKILPHCVCVCVWFVDMGAALTKCCAPAPPPVVFTICPYDCKAHDFSAFKVEGTALPPDAICGKCKQSKQQVDYRRQLYSEDQHEFVADYVPVPGQQPPAAANAPAAVAIGQPVEVIHKCIHCGLRRQLQQNGIYMYDDYYMYGGGYMAGMEMGLMFGIMGASNYAYMDPMYVDDYGGDIGFDADEDDDFGDMGFD